MTREEYRSILGRLPIKSPTREDMAMVCPHLTPDEAEEAFTAYGSIACPPLRIRNAFQTISYYKERVERATTPGSQDRTEAVSVTGTKNRPARLSWSFPGRTRAHSADGKPHGNTFVHADRAIRFAEDHWKNRLILDKWDSVIEFFIQDPADLVNDRYHADSPRTKAILYVVLNRDLNEILIDSSKPESELFDDAIALMTLDYFIWQELKGGRGAFTEYNCARCGTGLSLTSCTGCGYQFLYDGIRCGWDTPLSRRMVAFLGNHGHQFAIDPAVAWRKERQDWERSQVGN